jgi:L-lactate dehydrogenase complex protein LldG
LPDFPRVDAVNHPRDLENVDVAVVRARFGVAETGSVFLSDHELRVNTVAYLAQHLIVLLDPGAIVPGIADAYLRPDFTQARYVSLMTGPSATADIEGVLIRGAQGVRSLTVIFAKRS